MRDVHTPLQNVHCRLCKELCFGRSALKAHLDRQHVAAIDPTRAFSGNIPRHLGVVEASAGASSAGAAAVSALPPIPRTSPKPRLSVDRPMGCLLPSAAPLSTVRDNPGRPTKSPFLPVASSAASRRRTLTPASVVTKAVVVSPPNATLATAVTRVTTATSVCRICHQVFGSDEELGTHARAHPTAYPFRCEMCGTRSSSGAELHRHTVSVHGAEAVHPVLRVEYRCTVCKRTFGTRCSATRHFAETHRQPKCRVCGMDMSALVRFDAAAAHERLCFMKFRTGCVEPLPEYVL